MIKPYDWEIDYIFREESSFARLSVFEGYPMSKEDKEVTKKSLENLDNNYLRQKYICPQGHEMSYIQDDITYCKYCYLKYSFNGYYCLSNGAYYDLKALRENNYKLHKDKMDIIYD